MHKIRGTPPSGCSTTGARTANTSSSDCSASTSAGVPEAVITVADRATWLADATGGDLLPDRGPSAAPGDDRTAAQLVAGQAEFADALVLTGPEDVRVGQPLILATSTVAAAVRRTTRR